jgi:hypothetical protein
MSLERPDSITASAVSAREEIGRAVAQKIREAGDSRDLKRVAEDVLPHIEKFLESPEERRLRRMRAGVVVSSIGIGVTALMFLMALVAQPNDVQGFFGGAGMGIVTFCLGLGLLLSAVLFSRPRKDVQDHSADAEAQNSLDASYAAPQLRPGNEVPSAVRAQTTSNLAQPRASVTEHTTIHLKSDR